MQTAGDLLLNARLKKKLTYTQVSKLIKIPVKTLKALEKNQFQKLPPATYIKGFIKNYAQLVNLNSQKTIAVFKRDYHKHQAKKILPQGLTKPLNSPWQPTSTIRTIIAISLVALLLFSYLGISFYQLNQPPQLNISKPDDGITLTSPVLIKGKTDHDASLTLNGKTINLESDGSFITVYNGPVGTHELKLTATSRRHKTTQIIRHIIITE